MKANKQKSTQKYKKGLVIEPLIFALLVSIADTNTGRLEKYLTFQDPKVKVPKPFGQYTYSNTVIKYTRLERSKNRMSSTISFQISHAKDTIFDPILVLTTACGVSKQFQDFNKN